MTSRLLQVFVVSVFIHLGRGQAWDMWLDDYDESEGLLLDYEDDNSTSTLKLLQLSSTEIKREKELLEESSEIIVEKITSLMSDELIEANLNRLSEIISDHTVDVFNVLQQVESFEAESSQATRLSLHDIFIWSNISYEKLSEIIEDYYHGAEES